MTLDARSAERVARGPAPPIFRHASIIPARPPGPRPPRAARVGDVRLGHLGHPDHGHGRRLPHLLRQGRRRGAGRRRRHPAAGDGQHDRARDHRAPVAGARRGRPTTRASRSGCWPRSWRWAPPRAAGSSSSSAATGRSPRSLFVLAHHRRRRAASCSTSRCCRTSRATGRDRPRLDGRLRAGLPRRRAPAGAQPGVDPEARRGSGCRPAPGSTSSDATLPARLAFLSVAVWWLVFSIPLFRRVPEPPARLEPDERSGQSPVADGLRPRWARPSASCAATGRRS